MNRCSVTINLTNFQKRNCNFLTGLRMVYFTLAFTNREWLTLWRFINYVFNTLASIKMSATQKGMLYMSV